MIYYRKTLLGGGPKLTADHLISDLRLGDLNYLESVKPTLQRQGRDGLLVMPSINIFKS